MFYATPNADAGASIQSDQQSQLSSSKQIHMYIATLKGFAWQLFLI